MRVSRLEMQVPDVEAAIAWWHELLAGSEVSAAGVVDPGGLELRFVAGEGNGVRRLWVQVAPERLGPLAARHDAQLAAARDGGRFFDLEAPGEVVVRVFSEAEDEAYGE
jgi:hypothetical protein